MMGRECLVHLPITGHDATLLPRAHHLHLVVTLVFALSCVAICARPSRSLIRRWTSRRGTRWEGMGQCDIARSIGQSCVMPALSAVNCVVRGKPECAW